METWVQLHNPTRNSPQDIYCQEEIVRLQDCYLKITFLDTLLTLYRQPNSIHIGIKKLSDKIEEHTSAQILDFILAKQLIITSMSKQHTYCDKSQGQSLEQVKTNLTKPRHSWFTDVLKFSKNTKCKVPQCAHFCRWNFLISDNVKQHFWKLCKNKSLNLLNTPSVNTLPYPNKR